MIRVLDLICILDPLCLVNVVVLGEQGIGELVYTGIFDGFNNFDSYEVLGIRPKYSDTLSIYIKWNENRCS